MKCCSLIYASSDSFSASCELRGKRVSFELKGQVASASFKVNCELKMHVASKLEVEVVNRKYGL